MLLVMIMMHQLMNMVSEIVCVAVEDHFGCGIDIYFFCFIVIYFLILCHCLDADGGLMIFFCSHKGLLSEPKWGHLKDLHAAIILCEPALVASESPQYIKLGPNQEVCIFCNFLILL